MKNQKLINEQKKWYAKLKADGFQDLEYFDRNMEPRDWLPGSSNRFELPEDSEESKMHTSSLVYDSTIDYFMRVAQLAHEVSDPTHKKVLFLHADGLSLREIAKQVGFSHPKVFRIINLYSQKFTSPEAS